MRTTRSRTTRLTFLALAGALVAGTAGCSRNRELAAADPAAEAPVANDPNVLEQGEIQRNVSNMADVLEGRFPGVQVQRRGRTISVVIRGQGSINSSNEALIIVDGVDTPPHVLMEMSPRDVQRIEVLKDGAAAIYGVRGANGVLLITTRRE